MGQGPGAEPEALKKTSSLMNKTASTSRISKMKTVLGVTAALVCGVLTPTLASAQSYGTTPYGGGAYGGGAYANQGYYYDQCQRSTANRTTGGALAGGAIGMALGSGIAARGHRTDGSVLGGVLGAVVGGMAGKSSAACTPGSNIAPPPPPPPPPRAYNDGYDDDYRPVPYEQVRRDAERDSYYERSYERHEGYRVDNRTGQADVNGCTLAESPIYLPDGRVQKRFVRVCPDANGKYQVVD
jgi:hypothetical protein